MENTRGVAAAVAVIVASFAIAALPRHAYTNTVSAPADSVMAPRFEVDPAFPKALPNNWVLGMSVGVGVDGDDHVWIVHRPPTISPNERGADQSPPTGACCTAAPPVLEFDQAGNVLRHWGGAVPGAPYEWPESNHGISIDYKATSGLAQTLVQTHTSSSLPRMESSSCRLDTPAKVPAATTL